MGTFILGFIVIAMLVALPDIITKLTVMFASQAGKYMTFLFATLRFVLKKLWNIFIAILSSPLVGARDFASSIKWLKSAYADAFKKERSKKDFSRSLRTKEVNEKAKNQTEDWFYNKVDALNELKLCVKPMLSNNDFSFLDTPTFMRQGAFEVDSKGSLIRDGNGNPQKPSVLNMFQNASTSSEQESNNVAKIQTVKNQSVQAARFHSTSSYQFKQDDSEQTEGLAVVGSSVELDSQGMHVLDSSFFFEEEEDEIFYPQQ